MCGGKISESVSNYLSFAAPCPCDHEQGTVPVDDRFALRLCEVSSDWIGAPFRHGKHSLKQAAGSPLADAVHQLVADPKGAVLGDDCSWQPG